MKRLTQWIPILVCTLGLATLSVGCQSTGGATDDGTMPRNLRAGVPPQARQVSQGEGSLSYIASESGQLYLYDANSNRLVGTYVLRSKQELILTENGRTTIDGNEVAVNGEVADGRTYIAYFLPLPDGRGGSDGNEQTYRITPSPPERR